MAEEDSEFELEGFKKQLRSLFDSFLKGELGPESKTYCAKFCKLVEEYTGRWQEPLPQLRLLQNALCSFALGSACFPSDCEHVQCTLSSLALSVFELLLFYGPSDFLKSPLKDILDSIQECHSSFARHQNVHLLQVRQVIREGGSWASPSLHAILTETELPGDDVDRYLGSEMPVLLELRVRYLMANQRLFEAVSLAKACIQHSTGRRYLFFLQVYLTFLWKASHHDHLHKVIAEVDAKDAVDLICCMETEDGDNELVLSLCRAFLSQQLQRGDMYYIWHLVFIWSKLQLRVNPSKQILLDQSHQLMRFATNVRSIFPFMGVIMAEMGKEALQFCIELCIHALQSELSCDPSVKCLIYKTVAYLLPSDLDVCRACALLVFFSERSLEAYKTVFLLYTHPDQEYHAETSPVGNHVRFEILQVMKRGLYFDPEFWNLMALRTNCLKLMSEKVVNAALEEETWLPSCTKEPVCCWVGSPTSNELPAEPHTTHPATAKKRLHKGDKNHVTKRVKTRQAKTEETELTVNHASTRRGRKPGPPPPRGVRRSSTSPRRSFRQLDSAPENLTRQLVDRQHQHMTRLSEKKPPKRKIRKPRWLLEDSFTQAAPRKGKKPGRKPQQHLAAGVTKRSSPGVARSDAKQKTTGLPPILAGKELQTKRRKEFTAINSFAVCSLSSDQSLEVSQPDNELVGSFIDDTTNKLESPEPSCEKLPIKPQQTKPQPTSEVIIRARDECSFIMKMHSYAQRSKVKFGLPIMGHQASDSTTTTVTCPSDHRGPHEATSVKPKDLSVEMASLTQTSTVAEDPSKPHEGAVVPSGVPSADISSSDKSGQPNDSSYLCPSQNGIVHENTICANKVSVVHKKKSSKHMDPLIGALNEDNNSVPNVTNHSDTHVHKDSTARKCSFKVAQETLPTNELPTDAHITIVSDQPLPFKNAITPKEPADTENKAVRESMETDTDPQASGFLTEKTKVDLGEAVDKDNNTPKQQMAVDTNSGASPANKTLVLHCASVLPSKNSNDQIVEQNRFPTTKSQKEPEPNPGTGSQDTQEVSPASPDHPTSDPPQDPEDSHLMHRCTLCDKVFRGKCVVAHATYHYSQDQCMFCGMRFKNDILAMMHLSDHIEKLKKGQVPLGGDFQENGALKTSQAGHPTQSTSRRGRHKRPSLVSPGPTPSDSRKLRSSHKLTDTQSTDRNRKQCTKPKKEAVQRVNGHLRRRSLKIEAVSQPKGEETQRSGRQEENCYPESKEEAEELSTLVRVTRELRGDAALKQNVNNRETPCSSSLAVDKVGAKTGTLSRLQKTNKKRELLTIENAISAQENVCCPVEGCPWPSGQPKNRQSLLHHALEAHYGDAKPLELAFRLGNRRCSACSRVCWSLQHYQDHVERHRDTPRHPCLHQGCGARFKTGGEMRRHTRRHSPLQAGCCFSGCTTLFACLWALNLHEREHYGHTASTSATVKKTNKLGKRKKQKDTKDVKEQSGCKKDALAVSLPTCASNVNHKLKRAKVIRRVSVTEHSVQTRKDSSVSASNPGKAVSASTPGKAVSASTPGKAVSASTPCKAVSASIPGKAVSASTLGKAVSASTLGKAVSASIPGKAVSASIPGKAVSASTPGKAVSASTPGNAVEDLHETQALSEKDSYSVPTSTANTPATRKAQRIRLKRTAAKVAHKLKIKNGRGRPTSLTSRKTGLKRKEVVNPQSANRVTSTDSPSIISEETDLQDTEMMDQQVHTNIDASVVAPTSTVKVTDEVEMTQVNEECATQDKVTPTTPPSPSTKLTQKVQVNDEEKVEEPAAEHPSKASRELATQVLNILVKPKEVDPSNAPNKPANVETPASRKQPDGVAMEVESPVSLKTEDKPMVEALDSAVESPGDHLLNGHSESVKDSLEGDTLSMEAEQPKPQPESSSEARKNTDGRYVGRKPYIRPPPTAYLDEKFTTMPKRRKISWSAPCSPKIETLQKAQRQRCVKCFSSFDRPEELQAHQELKKCTSLFGFDSDEEGNW